jgi:hypothetical protein
MVSRVLLVTFRQALRSIVLSLLPITTITLIGWSLAGSQTGNTSDPLKASIWFWLATHLIPFNLNLAPAYTQTFFNYLPIAAVVLPFISIRSGFQRAVAELENERAARSFLTLWYGLIATLAALLMQSETVKPVVYLAPIYAGSLALISTINFKGQFFQSFRYFGNLCLIIFGVVAIGIAISLILHFSVMKSLTTVIEPGWVGGILLVIIQLLYIPNIIISAVAYFSGFGFLIGTATLVSPLTFKLSGIPAIPILAALPVQRHPFAFIFLLLPILLFIINLFKATRRTSSISDGLRKLLGSFWIYIPIALVIGYQSGGILISKSFGFLGVKWWVPAVTLLLGQLIIAILIYIIPQGVRKLVTR